MMSAIVCSYYCDILNWENQIKKLKEVNCSVIEHDEIDLMGLKIFASSYTLTPPYGKTAFQIEESKME